MKSAKTLPANTLPIPASRKSNGMPSLRIAATQNTEATDIATTQNTQELSDDFIWNEDDSAATTAAALGQQLSD